MWQLVSIILYELQVEYLCRQASNKQTVFEVGMKLPVILPPSNVFRLLINYHTGFIKWTKAPHELAYSLILLSHPLMWL